MRIDRGKNGQLPRGFKANAERLANEFRQDMGLQFNDPLCAFSLAKYLDITVLTPLDLLSSVDANVLLKNGSGWSGLTLTNAADRHVIVYNSNESPGRQQSTVMHELSHIICKHKLPEPRIISDHALALRAYDPAFELQANTMGGTLQLPRNGLLWALKKQMKTSEICDHFLASEQMVAFRINTTGVNKQISYARRSPVEH